MGYNLYVCTGQQISYSHYNYIAIADTVPHCLLDGVPEIGHVLDMSGSDHWVLSHHLLHLLPQFVLDIRIVGQGVHTPSHGRASLNDKDTLKITSIQLFSLTVSTPAIIKSMALAAISSTVIFPELECSI